MSNQFEPGDIVLLEVPFSDLSGSKKRPALVLLAADEDYLVAFITSQVHQAGKADVTLSATPANGLVVDSVVLVQKLFTIHESLISRKLGVCEEDSHGAVVQELRARLKRTLPKAAKVETDSSEATSGDA